jgi:GABA permease
MGVRSAPALGLGSRDPRRYLVVANLTVCGEQLAETIQDCIRVGPCTFYVVVPASADPHGMTWTEEEVLRAARNRLNQALSMLRALGADVSGEVGDWTPLLAIEDTLRTQEFDEIIVSTLSPGLSRWIGLDLPNRVAHRFGLPVSHVISPTHDSAGDHAGVAA